MPITLSGNRLYVETKTQKAVFADGSLISLIPADGAELLNGGNDGPANPLSAVYPGGEIVPVLRPFFGNTEHIRLSDRCFEIRFEGWEADGILRISEDPATDDIVVEPSVASNRSGMQGARWHLSGIAGDTRLVAPFYQGVDAPLDHRLIAGTGWNWPFQWEAGIAVFQSAGAPGSDGEFGFSVRCLDERFRYKGFHIGEKGSGTVSFETQAYGPTDGVKAVGGLAWRINVHKGDWRIPFEVYRRWLQKSYDLAEASALRPAWVGGITFAISWCPTETTILDALAAKLDPGKVLLHLPNWRTDGYDENYPEYNASPKASEFLSKARAMGFHAMPHTNANQLDPSHPFYDIVRDFQYIGYENHRIHGWAWWAEQIAAGRLGAFSVPQSYSQLKNHRDKKVMASIHPGLKAWRSCLAQRIAETVSRFRLDGIFTDVTLTTWNLNNCLVENMTPTEGMHKLIAELAEIEGGIAVGGEGLNEITMQRQAFAQAHLFRSHQENIDDSIYDIAAPVNAYLFEGLCRTIGYSNLSGKTDASALRIRTHLKQGAIPTVTVGSAAEIEKPNPMIAECLSLAGAESGNLM